SEGTFMSDFLFIFINVMLPIAIIVIIGYVVQLRFKLDRGTLAKLMINYIMPVFIFMNLFEADLELTLLMSVLMFLILYAALTFVLTYFIGRAIGLGPGHQILFTNSNLFYNACNYGVPVNDLVFRSDPFAMSVQIMMVFFQNMFAYSYGVVSLRAAESGKWKALLGYFKMPIFYGLALGLIFNFFNIGVPASVYISFSYDSTVMLRCVVCGNRVQTNPYRCCCCVSHQTYHWTCPDNYFIIVIQSERRGGPGDIDYDGDAFGSEQHHHRPAVQ